MSVSSPRIKRQAVVKSGYVYGYRGYPSLWLTLACGHSFQWKNYQYFGKIPKTMRCWECQCLKKATTYESE